MKQFIFIIILIVGGTFLSQQVLALTVSPVKFEIFGEPGQELLGEIILYNEKDTNRIFYSSSENFEARGEGGVPHFIPGIEGLAAWITTSERVVLKPGERKTIPFAIQIPKDTEPGGYFAAILWGAVPPQPQEGGQIIIGAKVGTLILLRVTGEVEERGALLEFSTKNNQRFFDSLPITFVYRFQNEGGDRAKPEGEIKIENIFGFITAVLAANPLEGNVLPGSIRKFEVKWEEQNNMEEKGFFTDVKHQWQNFAFGIYTAELNLSWKDRSVDANWIFFIIPWQLLSVVIVILVIISFFGVIGIKKYNQLIISRFKAKNISTPVLNTPILSTPILKEEKEQKDELKKKSKKEKIKEKRKKRKIKKRVKKRKTEGKKEKTKEKTQRKKTKNKKKIRNRKKKEEKR